MKLNIDRKELLTTLQKLQSISERRTAIPILANVLISTKEGSTTFYATNLEVGHICRMAAGVKEEGEISVPTRKLYDLVRELPEGDVNMEADEQYRMRITSGRVEYKIMGLPAEDYPPFPGLENVDMVRIEAEKLLNMISKTIFALSSEESRYNTHCIFLTRKDNSRGPVLMMAATDTYRLAMIEEAMGEEEKKMGITEGGVLISKRGAAEIKRLLEEAAGETVEAAMVDNTFFVRHKDSLVFTRRVEGSYLDVEGVIKETLSQTDRKKLRVNRRKFAEALKRVSVLASEESRDVLFRISGDKLELSFANPTLGEARDIVDAQFEGEDIEIRFNAGFILDVLNVLGDEEVELELKDSTTQGLIRSDGGKFLYIVMPMIS